MLLKKMIAMFCCILLLCSMITGTVFASCPGDGNIDGGGGNMGSGTSSNKWTPGNDGVRITVVNAATGAPVSETVDFSNKSQPGSVLHFGKVSKINYRNGSSLSLQAGRGYSCIKPAVAIPRIVGSSGGNNITEIKKFFCSEYACMMVADATGVSYEELIGGQYKIVLEPIAYMTYSGMYFCMTATEAALYDQMLNGDLRKKMPSLTHQNLPLAMFLEYADLGFTAWGGATSGKQNNADIINHLGIGIVRFQDLPPQVEIEAPDVEYRVDTDVITSIMLQTGSRITPEEPAKVTFHIMGRDYTVQNIVIPEDDSQVVWVKWHTPDTPQTITITVSLSKGYTVKDTFVAKIVDLNEKIPPDPLATDTNPGYSIPALPSNPQKLTSNWGVWSCEWEADWQWHEDWQWQSGSHTSTCTADCTRSHGHWEDEGEWVDEGDWKYDYTGYAASISGRMSLMPDDIVPTASGKNMKSGYGVKTDVEATLSTTAPASHVTNPQTAFSVFPEFEYNTFLRLLRRASSGRNAKFTFKENEYSTYGRNVHFTPIWFPDHSSYTVYTQVWDCWTPDGMLSVNVNDHVSIQGSLFDDWYTNRE